MKLYDYFRSSASFRVRIALHLKNINYEAIPVHLVNHGGEHHFPQYRQLNPQGLVPTLVDNEHILTQSLAIIEYLDEIFPTPALLPTIPLDKAHVRSLSFLIACDIHPLNNLRVINQLRTQFQATEEQIQTWYHHWLKSGFDAFENRLDHFPRKKPVCYGSDISLADVCLIPQVYNAKRFNFSLDSYPIIREIATYCETLPAFVQAAPESQVDG